MAKQADSKIEYPVLNLKVSLSLIQHSFHQLSLLSRLFYSSSDKLEAYSTPWKLVPLPTPTILSTTSSLSTSYMSMYVCVCLCVLILAALCCLSALSRSVRLAGGDLLALNVRPSQRLIEQSGLVCVGRTAAPGTAGISPFPSCNATTVKCI